VCALFKTVFARSRQSKIAAGGEPGNRPVASALLLNQEGR